MNNIRQKANESLLASGLIIVSLVIALFFFDWAYNALYDKKQIENRGHQYYAQKRFNKAYQDFSLAAELNASAPDVDKQKISESYRFAASAAYANLDFIQAAAMALKSLVYNPENTAAIELIKRMLKHKQMNSAQLVGLDQDLRDKIYKGQI